MNLYWIGARQWDIKDNNMFYGSITRYGDDTCSNYSFSNNTFTQNFNEFIERKLHMILSHDSEARFMFANTINAYMFGENVFSKTICLNPLHIIESLNDKIFTRNFFSDCIDVPNSIIINASSFNYNFIKEIFNNKYSEFVVQEAKGAGGLRNYFVSAKNIHTLPNNIDYIIVTPYFRDAISVNVHIVTSKESYKILPPSLQIILDKFKYSGSDFIAYNKLPADVCERIVECSHKIARKVMTLGAKGMFGVDFLITEDKLLFLECNYRYQGSSFVLNKALTDSGYPSLFELQYDSFYENINNIPDNIYTMPVPYSSFRRTEENSTIHLPLPKEKIALNNSIFASKDHYLRYELFEESIIQNIGK